MKLTLSSNTISGRLRHSKGTDIAFLNISFSNQYGKFETLVNIEKAVDAVSVEEHNKLNEKHGLCLVSSKVLTFEYSQDCFKFVTDDLCNGSVRSMSDTDLLEFDVNIQCVKELSQMKELHNLLCGSAILNA
ncbi:hypothetical protein BMW23_1159 [Bodo saltans virus]|uniref:Uncharacterized protein n=1 Tax=Bodo saltans virus TaxID=2024608 RepID=A0A2H4UW76_9VIRU|nr:hypothetical protein QJ851_gp1139 [Bodo saltans virus]ATZ81202.1 hypothetical protein BMW23_1159 [Bodo saltans virus]